MKHLNNAIRFFIRFYMLAIPLFILNALSSLINNNGNSKMFSNYTDMFGSFNKLENLSDPGFIFSMIPTALTIITGAGILAIIMKFIAEPATYGMINKAHQDGFADLNDFVPSLKQNFVKYLLYWIGTIVVSVLIGIAVLVVLLILGLLTVALKWFGVFLLIVAVVAMFIAGVVLYILMSLWFSAMVIDDLDVIGGFKRSIEIARANFLTILGVSVFIINRQLCS